MESLTRKWPGTWPIWRRNCMTAKRNEPSGHWLMSIPHPMKNHWTFCPCLLPLRKKALAISVIVLSCESDLFYLFSCLERFLHLVLAVLLILRWCTPRFIRHRQNQPSRAAQFWCTMGASLPSVLAPQQNLRVFARAVTVINCKGLVVAAGF